VNGELEEVRKRFRPVGRLHLLFLGESPPPGRGFFYTADSTLFRAAKPVFVQACRFPGDPHGWLATFADTRCYLDDFSSIRGDKPHTRPSAPDVRKAIRRLARVVSEGQPTVVVPVLREIDELAREVVAASTHPGTPLRVLRFPYFRSERAKSEFATGLTAVLREFGCSVAPSPDATSY
jgi:hypothetical protein